MNENIQYTVPLSPNIYDYDNSKPGIITQRAIILFREEHKSFITKTKGKYNF